MAVRLPAVLHTGISPEIGNPAIEQWLNRNAMRIPPPFTARRNPWLRNDVRIQDENNWDPAALKNIALGRERTRLQPRAEFVNAFNRVWFGSPDVNPAGGNYGRILSDAGSPRNIQLVLKLSF